MPRARVKLTAFHVFGTLSALVAAGLMMIDFQGPLIFPTHAVPAPGPLPAGAARVSFDAGQGVVLHGVHIVPRSPRKARMLVLAFAGNAWNSEDAADFLHQLYPEADVVAFHYRGYRPSTGTPSAKALLADAAPVYDFAVSLVKPKRIVAVGLSIGTGVAAKLATERRIDGLILVTPFDSLKAVVADQFPLLPVRVMFSHEIDAASPLRNSRVPTAMISAERDEIIPPQRTQALRRTVGNLVFDRTISGAGHNDIYQRSDFHAAMREAMAAVDS